MKSGVKSVLIRAQSYLAVFLLSKGVWERSEINEGSRSCILVSAHEGVRLVCAMPVEPSLQRHNGVCILYRFMRFVCSFCEYIVKK